MQPIKDQKNDFSFVIVRPYGRGNFTFRIKSWVIYGVFSSVLISVILIGFSVYFYTYTHSELADYERVKSDYSAQQLKFEEIQSKADAIYSTIDALMEKESQINYILQSESKRKNLLKKKTDLSTKVSDFRLQYQNFKSDSGRDLSQLLNAFLLLEASAESLNTEFASHFTILKQQKIRFASTPSIWPVQGSIRSHFGSRFHPVLGGRRFHAGIDIPSWIGAPIRSTADGIVDYSGWSGSYGLVIIVDHGYGYRTVYAHASQLLAKKGAAVKKGQVIAQVGTTGLSTGPHLHYEVHRWRRPVKPTDYLDVDMFTAIARLW